MQPLALLCLFCREGEGGLTPQRQSQPPKMPAVGVGVGTRRERGKDPQSHLSLLPAKPEGSPLALGTR